MASLAIMESISYTTVVDRLESSLPKEYSWNLYIACPGSKWMVQAKCNCHPGIQLRLTPLVLLTKSGIADVADKIRTDATPAHCFMDLWTPDLNIRWRTPSEKNSLCRPMQIYYSLWMRFLQPVCGYTFPRSSQTQIQLHSSTTDGVTQVHNE